MYTAIQSMHVHIICRLLSLRKQKVVLQQSYREYLLAHYMMHAQVSRTDANALIALDPVDLTVTRKFDYTSILPEAKVSRLSFIPLLLVPALVNAMLLLVPFHRATALTTSVLVHAMHEHCMH